MYLRCASPPFGTRSLVRGFLAGDQSKELEASTCYQKPQIMGPRFPQLGGQPMEFMTHLSVIRQAGMPPSRPDKWN